MPPAMTQDGMAIEQVSDSGVALLLLSWRLRA
jgi:hypothetical protein